MQLDPEYHLRVSSLGPQRGIAAAKAYTVVAPDLFQQERVALELDT